MHGPPIGAGRTRSGHEPAMDNEVLVRLFVVPLTWMSVYGRRAARSAASTSK